ncbi:hypothetical protein [Microbispora siamensis]|uniref:Uncharacterized protein n=1 Tax=Microbispora siamensis TaxID=564413 RepID=A0ABQ4GLN7_9ACTN|nr:hypothetical protein [Microbispora siamensis]GIH62290.1 hypothetical protein Msi02_31070 [Microbispora siamensis]
MIICSAAAALAATLIAGPVASADPAPPAGPSTGAAAPIAAPPDTAVYNPYYGPSGPDNGPAYTPVAMPVAAGPAPLMGQAGEPKQAVYHTKGKDGVRHDVFVVPISDDPSKPITLPDFGFQKFKVTDKPYNPKAKQHSGKQHWEKKHRHGGKAHRRHHRHR